MPAKIKNQFEPDMVPPPGETIRDALEELGMTQNEFALRMDLSPKHVSSIINGSSPITPPVALSLENVLRVPAAFWMKLDANYQEFQARQEAVERLQKADNWPKAFPIAKMTQRGWIPPCTRGQSQVQTLLQYFAVASIEAWEAIWRRPEAAFRASETRTASPEALSAWLRQGQILAESFDGPAFNASAFTASLKTIRGMVGSEPEDFCPALKKECQAAGVSLHLVPELPKLAVSGACFWKGDRPVILLNLYYNSEDHFWFNFFHEAKHVQQALKKRLFVDVPREAVNDQKETEANIFAQETLIPPAAWRSFIGAGNFSQSHIKQFAKEVQVPSGIVLGQLQHFKFVPWSSLNWLKRRFVWENHETGCDPA